MGRNKFHITIIVTKIINIITDFVKTRLKCSKRTVLKLKTFIFENQQTTNKTSSSIHFNSKRKTNIKKLKVKSGYF